MTGVVIAARFNGPPASGNGGYSCGVFAKLLPGGGDAQVTLRAPPPLATPMRAFTAADGVDVMSDGTLVAEVRPADVAIEVPGPVSFEAATAVATPPAEHPFPTCFVCGPERRDGLGIFAGAIPGRALVAAPWIADDTLLEADGRVASEFVWAALDCPGGWVPGLLGLGDRDVAVLGRLAAHVESRPRADERCVVVAWPLEEGERRWESGSAVYGQDGSLHAWARSTWIVPKGGGTPQPPRQ